jgi:heat shock protein HslJ
MLLGLALSLALVSIARAQQVPLQIPGPSMSAGSPDQLVGPTWRWVRSEYSDTAVDVNEPDGYTITFLPDGALGIRADCNRIGGTYLAPGDAELTLRLGPSTLVACPPGSQADVFTRDLNNVRSYVFSAGNLVFNLSADAGNMIFEAQPVASLTDTAWSVQSYNNGRGGVVSIVPNTQLTASFDAEGRVFGSAGCNSYRGRYTVDGMNINIGPLATTRMACPEPIMQQEQEFLAALGVATQYSIEGNRLTLRDAGGSTQVVLVVAT